MRTLLCFLVLCFSVSCGDDVAPEPDAGTTDAARDGSSDVGGTDRGTDAARRMDSWMDLTPPTCAELPAVAPPACGSGPVQRGALVPGPASGEHDSALAEKALRFDRGFHAIVALHTGVNTEVDVLNEDDRATIQRFLTEDDSWDLAAFAGEPVSELVSWRKVAGAYGGVGAAADAFRYAVLRDEGAACDEVERARAHLSAAIAGLRRATLITGVPGVVARGYQRTDLPGGAHELTPLFDTDGQPLPEEKNNGTWRADESGEYGDYAWEDSCSRDMLVGWVFGMAAVWEVIARDPTFADERAGLQADASAIAARLMEVGEMGYDLEIQDADGRVTFHGFMHEAAIDRVYIPNYSGNAHNATLALGIMGALAFISEDMSVHDYVYNNLIRRRALDQLVREQAGIVDFGIGTNFSAYNMSFTGAWLASRYLCDDDARAAVNEGITGDLYGGAEDDRHPNEQNQSFYDVVYLAARSQASAFANGDQARVDTALQRATETLSEFPAPPYWDVPVENCDAAEIEALACIATDGVTEIQLTERTGRGGEVVATDVLPMPLRPYSNYHWRSNPFRVNADGTGHVYLPGVDFRIAYWMGRYLQLD